MEPHLTFVEASKEHGPVVDRPDAVVDLLETGGVTGRQVAAGHLVVRHQVALPAASLSITRVQFSSAGGNPEIVLQALTIGVHDSDDWESVALGGDYTFAFLGRQES